MVNRDDSIIQMYSCENRIFLWIPISLVVFNKLIKILYINSYKLITFLVPLFLISIYHSIYYYDEKKKSTIHHR